MVDAWQGGKSDKFVFSTGDTGITEATADTIMISTGTDKIDIDDPGTYVEVDGTATADLRFITAAVHRWLLTQMIFTLV